MRVRLLRRLQDDGGFGLVELVISMVALNIALFALLASFTSGTFAVTRATKVSTAGVLADAQMERFRGMSYAWIGLDTSIATDSTYQGDSACVGGASCTNTAPDLGASACRSGGTVFANFPLNCVPTRSVSGASSPDGRTYRIDTYVRAVQSVASGNPRQTKVVTVVVRDSAAGNSVLARTESDFDYCTALPDPSGTGAAC